MTNRASSIAALAAQHALRAPAAPAILAPGRPTLSYAGLARQVRTAVAALAEAGHGRGDRVAVALPDGPESAVALVAVMEAATSVPLNPALDEASYRAAIAALRIDALIVPDGAASAAARAARSLGLPLLRLAVPSAAPAGAFTLVADASRAPVAFSAPAPDDIALVLHTSGTTSAPKAVPLAHRMIAGPSLERARLLRLTSADRCLCIKPLFARSGISRCLFPLLAVGGSVVCTPGLDGAAFVDWLQEFEPTFYSGSPAMHRAVLDEVARRGGRLRSTLRFVLAASAALPAALESGLEAALGVPVLQGCGTTETGVVAQNPLPPAVRRAGSVGLPFINDFAILGNAGTWAGPGEVGEILVRGPEVFAGYEGAGAAAGEDFFEGWFRTGDLGHVDRDGYLFIVGRERELVNRGGFKVSPSAVDAALMRHPGVLDAGTFAVPHATLGEDVATAVVLRESSNVSPRALRDFAFQHLPGFMVPSQVVSVASLGRTPAGKLNRAALALALRPRLRAGFTPPRDALESLVASVFADVLGIDTVGAFDNFFELGGDSLRGARAVVRINALRGTNLDVVSLFHRPGVAEFAAELARAGVATAEPPIRPRRDPGSFSAAAGPASAQQTCDD